MPELPEVETVVRTLHPQVVGKIICELSVLLPKSLAFGAELVPYVRGARIVRVFRRAKLVLMEVCPAQALELKAEETGAFEACPEQTEPGTLFLVFHLKMTGSFFVHPPSTLPHKHTRIVFDVAEAGDAPKIPEQTQQLRLFFNDIRTFGYCRIMRRTDFADWAFWQKLGPEPLETPPERLASVFTAASGGIKAALLNQNTVAGVGNIYADEALFQAGIHPRTPAKNLSPDRALKLALALQKILRRSIEECGSSIRNYTDAYGNVGAFQNNFAVYGKKGGHCPVCASSLQTEKTAGRTTCFCPHCQV